MMTGASLLQVTFSIVVCVAQRTIMYRTCYYYFLWGTMNLWVFVCYVYMYYGYNCVVICVCLCVGVYEFVGIVKTVCRILHNTFSTRGVSELDSMQVNFLLHS